MKEFAPKKVVIYGEDGDRVEIELNSPYQVDFGINKDDNMWDFTERYICYNPKRDISINNVSAENTTYYAKRTGKRYRKNRRGYR